MGNSLGRVFGKKESAPSTPDINKLRDTEDMLLKKQEFLEQKVENEMQKLRKELH